MDFETQDRVMESEALPRSEAESAHTPQENAPAAEKPKKKRRKWPTVLTVAIVAFAIGCAAVWLLHTVHVRFERRGNSFALIVEAGKSERKTAAPAEPDDLPPYLGTGKTMTISPSSPGAPNRPAAAADALSLQELYEKIMPSVVTVRMGHIRGNVNGVGVVLSEDGYIVTNGRSVERSLDLKVTVNDGETYPAVLVGSDSGGDVAVLKIEADGLTPAVFGDSDTLRVGDFALAVEAPGMIGTACTINDGIISGIDRDVMVGGRQMTLIRTNITSGNSGGPIFNCYGQVVALRASAYSRSYSSSSLSGGPNYALPISYVKTLVDQLMNQGFVTESPTPGWSYDDLPDRVRIYYGLPEGVYVTTVYRGTEADKAGIRAGDILTELNGQPIANVEAMEALLKEYRADDVIVYTVYRGGEVFEATMSQKPQT